MAKKSVQSNDPWKAAQPFILQGLQNSGRVFDQTQPQLEAFAGMQRDAYSRLAPGAEAGVNLTQGRVNDTLGGKFAGMNPGAATYRGMLDATNPAMAGTARLGEGGFVGQGAGADYFRDVVGGKFVNNNPFLNANIDAAIGDANDSVSSLFSKAGRYGSEANQSVLAREAGRISNTARAADLSAERDRQGQAAGALDGLTARDRGLQLSALGQQGDMYNSDMGIRAGAAEGLDRGYNLDQQRMDNAAGVSQDLMRGSQSLLDGAANLPWLGVGALNGNVRQASNGYGTTTTRTTDPAGLITGIAGAAATAYASDERIKKNVRKVGELPNGLSLNSYTMPDGSPQIGVLAQEVERKTPDAVGPTLPDGTKTVDYGALGMPDGPITAPQVGIDYGAINPNLPEKMKGPGGFERWLDSAVSPDASTTRGKIGLFGHALLAASGGAFGNVGNALLGARADRVEQGQFDQRMDLERRQVDGLANWRAGQGQRQQQPRIFQRRDGTAIMIDPETGEAQVIGEPLANNEPLVQVDQGGKPVYTPRSQAVGKTAYRPPARAAGGGGGVTANSRAKMIAEAEAAIARGAPREAVMARLAKMGVN